MNENSKNNEVNEDELKKLLNITDNMNNQEIEEQIDNLIEKQKNPEIQEFLTNSKKILIKNENIIESFDNLEENLGASTFQTNYIGSSPSNNIIAAPGGTQIQTSVEIPQTHTVETIQGSKNPYKISEYQSTIYLQSIIRNDITTPTNPFTNYVTINNVKSIALSFITLPTSWYNFDNNWGNTSFAIQSATDVSCIQIDPGIYDISDLLLTINQDISNVNISANFSWNPINRRVTIHNNSSIDLSFIFYDKSVAFCGLSCDTSPKKTNSNLGYYLGFRPSSNENLIIYVPTLSDISGTSLHNINQTIQAVLTLDEYGSNTFSQKIYLPENNNPTHNISQPSYYNMDVSCAETIVNDINIMQPTNNPKFTLAQLYTMEQIAKAKAIPNNQTNSNGISNPFSIVTLEHGGTIRDAKGPEQQAKIYLGPIEIYRLTVSLLDSAGNLLDLHGVDWGIGLEITQSYQLE